MSGVYVLVCGPFTVRAERTTYGHAGRSRNKVRVEAASLGRLATSREVAHGHAVGLGVEVELENIALGSLDAVRLERQTTLADIDRDSLSRRLAGQTSGHHELGKVVHDDWRF